MTSKNGISLFVNLHFSEYEARLAIPTKIIKSVNNEY